MFESKFLVNIEEADLNIHGQAPFITPVSAPNVQRGLELRFWIDPTCPAPLSIDIELDLYGSLGKIVMRFQTVLVAFPYIIIIMTIRIQLREYNRGGKKRTDFSFCSFAAHYICVKFHTHSSFITCFINFAFSLRAIPEFWPGISSFRSSNFSKVSRCCDYPVGLSIGH